MKLCISLEIDKTMVNYEFWSVRPSVCSSTFVVGKIENTVTKLSVSIGIDKTAVKIEFGEFLMNGF